MRSFKDLNVAYKPEDGKKRFPGVVVSIRELVNLPIVVKDFETGIKTEQGEDRCIAVSYTHLDVYKRQLLLRSVASSNTSSPVTSPSSTRRSFT